MFKLYAKTNGWYVKETSDGYELTCSKSEATNYFTRLSFFRRNVYETSIKNFLGAKDVQWIR